MLFLLSTSKTNFIIYFILIRNLLGSQVFHEFRERGDNAVFFLPVDSQLCHRCQNRRVRNCSFFRSHCEKFQQTLFWTFFSFRFKKKLYLKHIINLLYYFTKSPVLQAKFSRLCKSCIEKSHPRSHDLFGQSVRGHFRSFLRHS